MSHWNGYPDFNQLKAQGHEFVFSKATQGTWLVDETYLKHTQDARNAGLVAGAYHFFDYRKGGKAQAKHFLDTLRATTGLEGLMPLVVDVETLKSLGTPDRTLARQRLTTLLDELYRQTGRYPMIYTSRHMWEKVVGAPATFGAYPLWVACWKCDTVYLPKGWSSWRFWQFGQIRFDDGTRLDGNVYHSNVPSLRSQQQRDATLDGGAEWAASKTVQADLRGYDGADVRYARGGEAFGPWLPYQPLYPLELSDQQGPQEVRIQLRSFRGTKSPILTEGIKLDSVPPKVSGPRVSMREDVRVRRDGARVPTTVDMSARDTTSGLRSSALKATCRGKTRATDFAPARNPSLTVQLDRRGCTLKGTAKDVVGHKTTRLLRPVFTFFDARSRSKSVKLSGAWSTKRSRASLGKTLAQTTTRGASATLRFTGSQFAVVTRRGPAGGQLQVLVDGKLVETLDLYAARNDNRRVVHVGNVPKGRHVLRLRATGSGTERSAGSTVWLDAILVLDRRK